MQRDGASYNPVRLAAVFMIVTGLFGIILGGWPLHISDHYALYGETVALYLAVCWSYIVAGFLLYRGVSLGRLLGVVAASLDLAILASLPLWAATESLIGVAVEALKATLILLLLVLPCPRSGVPGG